MSLTPQLAAQRLEAWLLQLSQFPWRTTVHMLRVRYREDRLGLTASSLTFTTLLALVPFATVALAVFTVFPAFGEMQRVLERWLMDSLIPATISRSVLDNITQFATKASSLGVAGFSFLALTSLMLMQTIDRTLNNIWRVRDLRPLGQRVLVYWAVLTLGPLVLAGSLALTTSVAAAASQGLGGALPGAARLLFDGIEFLVLSSGMAALYHYVPNTHVRWRHAWAGGVFVSVGISLAKNVLVFYLASVPTYSVLYGTFATLPILLLWVYVAWVIVLLGAVVAAYLPSLLAGVFRPVGGQGWQFLLAVEVLAHLQAARGSSAHGLTATQLARLLRVDVLQLEPVLETLTGLDWVAQLSETAADAIAIADARYVLLARPAETGMQPLVQRLLLVREPALEGFWHHTGLEMLTLADVLSHPPAVQRPPVSLLREE
ncbi:YihY family inner membrane protein [Melaminivora sp.]|uniref:YihY family inner membrane protein n=1 Tax=Melaminivora sp. TaxID=1933032 RepID=UPI0028AA5384|nr:YihY family inner membrane protein [Melaminivora sp.]